MTKNKQTRFFIYYTRCLFDAVYFHRILFCCPLDEPDYHFYFRCPILVFSISIIRLNTNNVLGCHYYQCLLKDNLTLKKFKPLLPLLQFRYKERPTFKYRVKLPITLQTLCFVRPSRRDKVVFCCISSPASQILQDQDDLRDRLVEFLAFKVAFGRH